MRDRHRPLARESGIRPHRERSGGDGDQLDPGRGCELCYKVCEFAVSTRLLLFGGLRGRKGHRGSH